MFVSEESRRRWSQTTIDAQAARNAFGRARPVANSFANLINENGFFGHDENLLDPSLQKHSSIVPLGVGIFSRTLVTKVNSGPRRIDEITPEELRVVVNSGRQVAALGPMPVGEHNVLFSNVAHLRRAPVFPPSSVCSHGIRFATGSGSLGAIRKVENPDNTSFPRGSRNHVAFQLFLGYTSQDGYTQVQLNGVDFYTGERLAVIHSHTHILVHLAFGKKICLFVFIAILFWK